MKEEHKNMTELQNLIYVSDEEFKLFINSFDFVISDIDGTLIINQFVIPGAPEFIKKIKKLGKKVAYVTNNPCESAEQIIERTKPFDIKSKDLFYPSACIANYLKINNCKRDLFVIGTAALKKELKNNGFNFVNFEDMDLDDDNPKNSPNDIYASAKKIEKDIENIGAVVIEYDVTASWQMLQAAVVILNTNQDIPLLFGSTDWVWPISKNMQALGSGFLQKAVMDLSGRTPVILAKPSSNLKSILKHNYPDITEEERVLVIGDSISADMGLASNCGFQKLLVLTGLGNVDSWSHEERLKPDYYVDNVGMLNDRLNILLED